jgi:hypothetical protein
MPDSHYHQPSHSHGPKIRTHDNGDGTYSLEIHQLGDPDGNSLVVVEGWDPSALAPVKLKANASGELYIANPGTGGGSITIPDGDDATQGALADVAVHGDASGSLSAKLRGLLASLDYYTEAVAYDANGNIQYKGWAAPGTAKASAGWRIMKITYDGSQNITDKQWADGDLQFNNIWNNREGLSYS